LDNIDLIKKPAVNIGDNDGDDSDAPQARTGAKRVRTLGSRIAKGEDFWSKVDAYFVTMTGLHGRDLSAPGWKE
jgi:hypothetical protein